MPLLSDLNFPQPSDMGMDAWSFPSILSQGGVALVAGTIYAIKVTLPDADQFISTIYMGCTSAGAALSNCSAGLYDPSGAILIAKTGDVSTQLQSTGLKTLQLTGQPIRLAAALPFVWAAIVAGAGTTLPSMSRAAGTGTGISLANLNAPIPPFQTHNVGGLTALPVPLSLQTANSFALWVGLS